MCNQAVLSAADLKNVEAVLAAACRQVGLDPAGAEPIRFGENALLRLPGQGIVVRITRHGPGALATASKEVRVARWLAAHGVSTIRALDDFPQPVEAMGRVITFWDELPPHHYGSYPQIAEALRQLHGLPAPADPPLEPLAPFLRLADRIDGALTLRAEDRAWMHARLEELQAAYERGLPPGLGNGVVHGDASAGNIVGTGDGQVVVLDLERLSIGPPEWDLTATAIDYTTFGDLDEAGYREFCQLYGYDVMTWPGFPLLRDMAEFRITCWMAQRAVEHPDAQGEAKLRVACLQGKHGPRPWAWKGVL